MRMLSKYLACMALVVVCLSGCGAKDSESTESGIFINTEDTTDLQSIEDGLEIADDEALNTEVNTANIFDSMESVDTMILDSMSELEVDGDAEQTIKNIVETFSSTLYMSRGTIIDTLLLKYEDTYGLELIEQTVDSLGVDWDNNALNYVTVLNEIWGLSEEATYLIMTNVHGGNYSDVQTEKALSSANIDWKAQAVRSATYYKQLDLSDDVIYNTLIEVDMYTEEQSKLAVEEINKSE